MPMSTDTADTDSEFRKVVMQELTLYASPVSLYSGKARSYLIKAAIPYREIPPGNAHYREQVLPKAGGPSIPAIELADGAFEAAGLKLNAIAQPYRFFLLKRVQEAVTALDDQARERVDDLLARSNMADVLAARLDREIGWADNREVWL